MSSTTIFFGWKKRQAYLSIYMLAITFGKILAFTPSPSVVITSPPSLSLMKVTTRRTTTTPTTRMNLSSSSNNRNNNKNKKNWLSLSKSKSLVKKVWKRMDTLEASGLTKEYSNIPPLVSRMGPMAEMRKVIYALCVPIALRWYYVCYKRKMGFFESKGLSGVKQSNTKEEDDQLNTYTCLKCGSSLFVARGREFRFNLDRCYACGVSGKEHFVLDRQSILEEIGDEEFLEGGGRMLPKDFLSDAADEGIVVTDDDLDDDDEEEYEEGEGGEDGGEGEDEEDAEAKELVEKVKEEEAAKLDGDNAEEATSAEQKEEQGDDDQQESSNNDGDEEEDESTTEEQQQDDDQQEQPSNDDDDDA